MEPVRICVPLEKKTDRLDRHRMDPARTAHAPGPDRANPMKQESNEILGLREYSTFLGPLLVCMQLDHFSLHATATWFVCNSEQLGWWCLVKSCYNFESLLVLNLVSAQYFASRSITFNGTISQIVYGCPGTAKKSTKVMTFVASTVVIDSMIYNMLHSAIQKISINI